MSFPLLRIQPDRFLADFEEMSAIGATGDGGVNRPALSEAHLALRAWFKRKAEEAGLEFHMDGAGNHSAVLRCPDAGARTLLVGSHLDSVPRGGRFDGALGVLGAMEALRTVKGAGLSLPVHLEAIDFTDEEGTLASFLGSFAMTGKLTREELDHPRGGREALEKGLRRAGLSEEGLLTARRDPAGLAGYLELHIEQGERLIKAGKQAGLVERIAGIAFGRLTFTGRADHAGSAPMDERLDAAQGASAFTLEARRLVMRDFPGCFCNVGQAHYLPGAFNIVPEKAILSFELRAPSVEQFQRLKAALVECAQRSANEYSLGVEAEMLGERLPVEMHPKAQAAVEEAARELGLSTLRMVSYAGHDAQPMAELCPCGMIFIPSSGGSHSPREYASPEDCVNGANILLQAALKFLG